MLSVSDYSVLCSWVFKVDGALVFQTTVLCVAGCLR